MHSVPKPVAKAGIESTCSNKKANQSIHMDTTKTNLFMAFFGEEIRERLSKKQAVSHG